MAIVVYNSLGIVQASPHLVADKVNLVNGSVTVALLGKAAYASATSYTVVATDTSASEPTFVGVEQVSGSKIIFSGTGSDEIAFVCVGL